MKTTILSLVLASIAGFMYCSDESLAVTQEPEDKELRALLESRRDTLKQAVEILFVRYRSMRDADIYSLIRLNAEMLEAELLLAESTESRIKLLEESLTLYKQVEAIAEAKMNIGQGTQLDVVLSKADRIKLEIELYKAKKGNWQLSTNRTSETPASVQEPEDKELRELLESRRDVLREVLEDQRTRAGIGVGDHSFLGFARNVSDLMNVKLELARTKEERIAIIEASLTMLVQTEEILEAKVRIAPGSQSNFLFAKADRLKVEIELYRVKKGEWPLLANSRSQSSAVTQEPEDKELRALLESRRDALKSVLKTQRERGRQGSEGPLGLAGITSELMNVELELARTREERLAIIEASLAMYVQIEQYRESAVKARVVSKSDLLFAKADWLKIEIDLYKAKKGI